jgi:hypothetical protein
MNQIFESFDSVVFEFDDQNQAPPQPAEIPESGWRHILGHFSIPETALGSASLDLKKLADQARQQTAVYRQEQRDDHLLICLGNQALILKAIGDLDGALRLLKEQETICRRLDDPNGLAFSLVNQASLLAFNQARPGEGLPLAEESLRLATRHGLTALARQIEPILNRVRGLLQ